MLFNISLTINLCNYLRWTERAAEVTKGMLSVKVLKKQFIKKLIEGADASVRFSLAKYGRNDSVTASLVELSPMVHR